MVKPETSAPVCRYPNSTHTDMSDAQRSTGNACS